MKTTNTQRQAYKRFQYIMLLILLIYSTITPSLVFAGAAEKLPEPEPKPTINPSRIGPPGKAANDPHYHPPREPANDGVWQEVGKKRKGATTIYTGQKTVGGKIFTGISKTLPTVKQVAKKVINIGPAGAVRTALDVLLGATEYVMSEENNRVIFTSKDPVICYSMGKPCFGSVEEAEKVEREWDEKHFPGYDFTKKQTQTGYDFISTGKYSDGRPDIRTASYYWVRKQATAEQVAEEIIRQAEAEKDPAKEFVGEVADQNSPTPKKNADFEATKSEGKNTERDPDDNPNANPANNPNAKPATNPHTNPANNPNKEKEPEKDPEKAPEKEKQAFELPEFCSWASTVCEFIDWVKKEPERQDEATEVETQDIDIGDFRSKANTDYVQSSSTCPADVKIPIVFMGGKQEIILSYQPFCYFASMIKPAVILGAWISGLMIIVGGRSKE